MLRPLCALMLSSVLLSGCMFFESSADRQIRHQPNFRIGYEDGCSTATNEGANMRYGDMVRDDALYESDKAYRSGWATGHGACRRMAPTNQSQGPLPDANPGVGH